MKATQKQIARKAGVSQCTVSHVLRGIPHNNVRKETVDKILFLAGDMGYQQRFIPVQNNEKATKNIGYLIIPSTSIQNFVSDPYYARFVSGLSCSSEQNKFNLVIYNNYSHLMQSVLNNQVEGVIVESSLTAEEAKILAKRVPAVFLNWRNQEMTIDSVMPDNTGGIKKAVFRLFSLGHRNIAFFGMRPFELHAEERLAGYRTGLKKCGLDEIPEYIQLPEAKRKCVEEIEEYAIQTLQIWLSLKNKPTALIAMGDMCALPLIRMAHKMEMQMPEELSIIGFDNRISCRYSTPSLSSIEQPMEKMAKKAMSLLLERINDPDKPIENVVFDVELIERESICEKKRKKNKEYSMHV